MDGHAAVGGHRLPRGDVRLVVEGRDDDLVAAGPASPRCERPMCERQRRHVVAELDLVGRAGPEEVGDGRVRLVDHRVRVRARRERPVGVGVRVAVVGHDRIDHPLRDLRPAGTVEEGDRSPVLLAGERRELGAQGVDIEGGHRSSGRSRRRRDRARSVPDQIGARACLSQTGRAVRSGAAVRPDAPTNGMSVCARSHRP